MGNLQKLLGQILARLRDINASQRVALVLGGALVAVSLLWLVNWAATPELVPLLEQDLPPEDLALVRSGLELMNEPFEVRGSRVYVRSAANRQALLAQLQQQEKLPANTSAAFAALIKESNPWISMEESDRRWTFALQQTLEQVLRQLQGVKSASVFLNLGTHKTRMFTRTPPPSSASVTLVMKNGEVVSRPLALAAARLVSGAVSGLPVHNVEVVDANGRVALDWDTEQDVTTLLDRKLAHEEQRYATKIRQILADPKALLSVQVELNSTASNVESETPTKGQEVSSRTDSEKTVRGSSSDQPGVQPNVGIAAGGGGLTEQHERDTSETEMRVGVKRETAATPAGDVKLVTAAISLSHSYLAAIFARSNGAAAEPSDEQIESVFQQERDRLLKQVVQLVKPQDEANVAISRYFDAMGDGEAGPGGRVDEALHLLRAYGPQAGLACLALLALGFMFRMARKSDVGEAFGLELGLPKEALEAARAAAADISAGRAPAAGARAAGGKAGVAGATAEGGPDLELAAPIEQAALTEGMLVAQEVDAGTVQTRKMVDQIAQMVNNDAELVATLIEQWVVRNEQYREE